MSLFLIGNGGAAFGNGTDALGVSDTYPAFEVDTGSIPTDGLVLHLEPESIVQSGGVVTGWRNTINNTVLSINGPAAVYTSSDPDFNGFASLDWRSLDTNISSFTLTAPAGITVVQVLKNERVDNSQGAMLWYMVDTDFQILDLWANQDPPRYNNQLVLNTFGGSRFGFADANSRSYSRIVTSRVPSQNVRASRLFENGIELANNTDVNGIQDRRTSGQFSPVACVPPAPEYNWRGRVSRVLVYNRLLTDTELASLHTNLKYLYDL